MKSAHRQVVEVLKGIRGKKVSQLASPTGLPAIATNADVAQDGAYTQEDTIDPGIVNGVTGTGNGPIIGRG